MENSPKYIDEYEVSRIIGRSVFTLRNDRFKGIGIPYTKFGRSVRYSSTDVYEYMESRKIKTEEH